MQQFFALAFGAFIPIKIFLNLHERGLNKFWDHFNESGAGFLAIIFFSVVFSGMWILKDKVPQSINQSTVKHWHIMLFSLIGLMACGWFVLLLRDLPVVTASLLCLSKIINHQVIGCK